MCGNFKNLMLVLNFTILELNARFDLNVDGSKLTIGSGLYDGREMTTKGDSSSLSSIEVSAACSHRYRLGRHTFVIFCTL